MLPDGQPPTAAFTVLAYLCGPKAQETEMGATLFTKKGEGRTLPLTLPGAVIWMKLGITSMATILILRGRVADATNRIYRDWSTSPNEHRRTIINISKPYRNLCDQLTLVGLLLPSLLFLDSRENRHSNSVS